MARDLYASRDRVASNSYTLHSIAVNRTDIKSNNPNTANINAVHYLRTCFLGNVTFTRSKSGMTTTCYFHLFDFPIVRATAGGYDVQSEALRLAWLKLQANLVESEDVKHTEKQHPNLITRLGFAVSNIESKGLHWKDALETKAAIFAAHIGG